MSLEKQLIEKAYYEMFINEHEQASPIRVLGDAYQEELQKEMPDLSYIRFAQGEFYFRNNDFEAAIFKWEQVAGEFGPWAKKNIADAYYETGLLSNAEDLYLAIDTDNLTLKMEVALKLFSLYIERGKHESAIATIKKAIVTNPDYPNVTKEARAYFEERKDFENAVELAVNEAKRTGSAEWYETLNSYVNRGVTKRFAPNYFSQALFELYSSSRVLFEQLVSSFWDSYKKSEYYFAWLKEVNFLFLNLELNRNDSWSELSRLHKETYFELIDGKLLIKQLEEFVPDLLTNWLRLADTKNVVIASAAVLSWSELFPATISVSIAEEAEKLISHTEHNLDEMEECLLLLNSIMDWASLHDMGENNRVKWMVRQLTDMDTHHLMVTGFSGGGKSSFINTILGEEIQDSPTSTMVLFKDHEGPEITEINDQEIINLPEFADFQERMDRRRNALESIIEFKHPFAFLNENKLSILDTPGFNGSSSDLAVLNYLQGFDTILFVLDANDPLTEKERGTLAQMQSLAPDIPIHFLLNKLDTIPNEQDALTNYDSVSKEITAIIPEAKVFAFSKEYDNDLKEFITSIKMTRNISDKRLAKLLYFIRTTITSLLQKRIDVENKLIESVRWNEELLTKLNGAIHQVEDTISQKSGAAAKSYRSIKEAIQLEITEAVPKMLKECSLLIKEDSNFSKIHLELNDVMNKRIQDYLENTILPKYFMSLQNWINLSREEFIESQAFLDEMASGFNNMYGEDRIKLACDFKMIEDWRRDTDRMTSRFNLEKINILMRNTPSQLLLKSTGKLLGAISKNKSMLYNRYKSFVENEDYLEVVEMVCDKFFQQFELFENALQRDITLFYKNPLAVLNQAAEEANSEIQHNKEILKKMNTNPEMFRDPLMLFEVRLRQFEWMTVAGKGLQTIY